MASKLPRSYFSKVSGVEFENPDQSSRQQLIKAHCKPGMSLVLIREPKNQYDKNAVAAWIVVPGSNPPQLVQVGYLTKNVVSDLASHLDRGGAAWAFINHLTGGTENTPTLGVNIKITIDAPEKE